ncbi:MAG: ATPase, partial [Candidatus Dependentiae bacterium]|nr:ATPase [Candidatus Dependentiae bacterium]
MKNFLGYIASGSLTEGFVMRISPHVTLEQIKTGKFVSIVGTTHTFFSLVTDLSLEVAHPDILLFPPTPEEKLLARTLKRSEEHTS